MTLFFDTCITKIYIETFYRYICPVNRFIFISFFCLFPWPNTLSFKLFNFNPNNVSNVSITLRAFEISCFEKEWYHLLWCMSFAIKFNFKAIGSLSCLILLTKISTAKNYRTAWAPLHSPTKNAYRFWNPTLVYNWDLNNSM